MQGIFERANRDILKDAEGAIITLAQDPMIKMLPVVNLKIRPVVLDLIRVIRDLDERISKLEDRR